jgi:hypothetical protein
MLPIKFSYPSHSPPYNSSTYPGLLLALLTSSFRLFASFSSRSYRNRGLIFASASAFRRTSASFWASHTSGHYQYATFLFDRSGVGDEGEILDLSDLESSFRLVTKSSKFFWRMSRVSRLRRWRSGLNFCGRQWMVSHAVVQSCLVAWQLGSNMGRLDVDRLRWDRTCWVFGRTYFE